MLSRRQDPLESGVIVVLHSLSTPDWISASARPSDRLSVEQLAPGTGALDLVRVGSCTVLRRALATSPLKLLNPRAGSRAAWVYAATYGGGLVGGDAIHLTVSVGPGAYGLLATQASTKVYRSTRPASQHLSGRIEDDALLVVAPDPIVCFAGSSFQHEQRYELSRRASLVVVDWFSSGRHATGERWAFDRYASRLEICRQGRRLLYDGLLLAPDEGPIGERMGRFDAWLVAALVGPLVSQAASRIVATISALSIERRSDLIVSAAPLGDDGALLRMAGVSVERVSAALRAHLSFLCPLLGDDPWIRKW